MNIRRPAVAGLFYPDDPEALRRLVRGLLDRAPRRAIGPPKALIAPHAGYAFSGPIAASAYAALEAPGRHPIRRVVILGTAHSRVEGLATSRADAFATPLGVVPLDRAAIASIEAHPEVAADDAAHAGDHAIEVQLPFLQQTLGAFALVPVLVGRASDEGVAEVVDRLWGGPETLVVVSTDLSHYHAYDAAKALDRAAAEAIERMRPEALRPEQACGRRAVAGLLRAARRHGLQAACLDLRSSGDTAGPRDRVVGYGAFALFAPPAQRAIEERDAVPPGDSG
jgi:AmmeMemoRadiSam system protein B